ncbi:MAG: PAS domain-containing protein [Chloroflexaceae bacterium]|nr:PAS domain-containing protein [Chloroflexaceae bacterium]
MWYYPNTEIGNGRSPQQQKKASLKPEYRFIASMVNAIRAPVIVLDVHGRMVHLNPDAEHVTGRHHHEVYGLPVWEMLVGLSDDMPVQLRIKAVQSDSTPQSIKTFCTNRDGDHRLIEWTATSVCDDEGSVTHLMLTGQDMTIQWQVEASLREALEADRVIARNFPNGAIVVFDHDLRIRIADGVGLAAVGLDGPHMEGKTIWEIFPPETCALIEPQYRAALEGVSNRVEVPYNGSIFLMNTVPVRNQRGDILAGMVVTQDITSIKETEAMLLQSRERIATILESITDAFFAVDSNWNMTYINAQAEQMLRSERANLLGQHLWDLFPDAANGPFYQHYHRAMAEQTPVRFEEYYPPLDTWVEVHAYPSRDGLSVYFRDVTERKHLEESLRKNQALLQGIVDNIPASLYVQDANANYILINRHAASLVGMTPDDITGRSAYDLFPADVVDQWRQNDATIYRTGQPTHAEETVELADGTMFHHSIKFPIVDEHGMIYAVGGISTDISDLKRAEQERIELLERESQARQQAEAANRSLAQVNAQMQQLNEQLEERVLQRTAEVRAQAVLLAELSTPLIPISDDVLVMPLVGSVDTQRAQQVMETLLQGIEQNRARIAILDITGVPVVDTQVANTLIQAAQATRLLGAQVVLTGIRPQIAQTLVNLGVELRGIITRSNLQAGIAYAMR